MWHNFLHLQYKSFAVYSFRFWLLWCHSYCMYIEFCIHLQFLFPAVHWQGLLVLQAIFFPKGHQGPCNNIESLNPAKGPMMIDPVALWSSLQHLPSMSHSPYTRHLSCVALIYGARIVMFSLISSQLFQRDSNLRTYYMAVQKTGFVLITMRHPLVPNVNHSVAHFHSKHKCEPWNQAL